MLGTKTLDALAHTKVVVFGLGGVGSWCAKSLVRSGIGKLLLVNQMGRHPIAVTSSSGVP